MGIASDMKHLCDEITSSFDARVATIEDIVKETKQSLRSFKTDRMEMAKKQATELAKFASEMVKTTKALLRGFHSDHQEMSEELREGLAKVKPGLEKYNRARLQEAKAFAGQLADFMEKMADEIAKMLKTFHGDRQKMATAQKRDLRQFRSGLQKSNEERIEEAQEFAEKLAKFASDMASEVKAMLKGFHGDHQKMATALRTALGKVKPGLEEFNEERLEEAKKFANYLAKFVADNKKEVKALLKEAQGFLSDLHDQSGERHEEVMGLLKNFHNELKKAGAQMRQELAKYTKGIQTETHKTLSGFHKEREEMADAWADMTSTMERKRTGAHVPTPTRRPARPKKGKATTRPKAKKGAAKKAPSAPSKEKEILGLLKENPDGMTLPEVAYAMGVPFASIANTAKALLESGKIQKRDNLYHLA